MELEKRDRIAAALDEVRNGPAKKLQRFEAFIAEASDRIEAPEFPEENRPAARERLAKCVRDYVEEHQRDPFFDKLAHELGRDLGSLAVPPPLTKPAEEIEKRYPTFRELGFKEIEIDNLRLSLKPGERIVAIGVRTIDVTGVKGSRSIDRYGLRAIRPAIIQGEFVEKWESQFPTEADLLAAEERLGLAAGFRGEQRS